MIKIYESETRYNWNDKNQEWDITKTDTDEPVFTLPNIKGATLLSVDEAEKYLNEDERSYYSDRWWWLRSPGIDSDLAADVRNYGKIHSDGFRVGSYYHLVRPTLQITNLKSSGFKVGDTFKINGYEFKVISPTLAWLHRQDIGKCPFNKNKDDNNYNKSDIKRYVDNWFNTEIKPYL